jgi:ABC-type multidrug transport system fused ATPase/permease subunit
MGATQEEIERAANLAHAHDFILEFPDQYQTQVKMNTFSG